MSNMFARERTREHVSFFQRDEIRLGTLLGLIFGLGNLLYARLNPLSDDTPAALLAFYGPMFLAWGCAGYVARLRSGMLRKSIWTSATVALVTFTIFYAANLVRVNLFLETLRMRADWQGMLGRFEASHWGSLRAFINYDYLKGAPFKIGVASLIGATMGFVGGLTGALKLRFRRGPAVTAG